MQMKMIWPNSRVFLSRWFDDMQVVGYIRAPIAMMESKFQQLLRRHYVRSLGDCYPHYRASLEKFDSIFGRESVQLWKFDPTRFPEGNVVRDFSARLQIPLQQEWLVRANDALSRDAVSLLYAWRLRHGVASTPEEWRFELRLIDKLRALSGPKVHFGEALLRAELGNIAGDVAWMEERLGESLAEESAPGGIDSLEELADLSATALAWVERQLGREIAPVTGDCEQLADWVEELVWKADPAAGN